MPKKLYLKWMIAIACLMVVFIIMRLLPPTSHGILQNPLKQFFDKDATVDDDENTPIPTPVPLDKNDIIGQPADTSALGGYNVLIADRGNNRLIEVTPEKKIVWEYHFDNVPAGFGADDSFFTDNGKSVIVNLEGYNTIQIIDYATKQVTWNYGSLDTSGKTTGILHTPDDAYKLPNGDIIVADIKNCRILEISPEKKIVRQYGETRVCKNADGFTNKPNGDTPLPDGHVLISNIVGHDLVELDSNWKPIFKMSLPVIYPSDPQLTKAGNILVADYSDPGQIVEVSKKGELVWKYAGDGVVKLNKPSLAIELPNGNILTNDDFNHRVIVIDKNTKQIVWQYGVTLKPGNGEDQLNIPDGLDIIKRAPLTVSTPSSIGSVTRHSENFIDKDIRVGGYLLKQENGYAIFSDEPNGTIGYYDLPVSGTGVDTVKAGIKYTLEGKFTKSVTAKSSNGSPFVLELSSSPQLVN